MGVHKMNTYPGCGGRIRRAFIVSKGVLSP